MIYASYDYYLNQYFGRGINEEDFQRFALHASQYLDYITKGRAKRSCRMEEVKMCCCALADQYHSIEAARELAQKSLDSGAEDGAEVQSEAVGSWSRSYRSGGDSAQAAAQAEAAGRSVLLDTARQYLAHTGLLYRGGRCCHEHVSTHGNAVQHGNRDG